MLKQIRLDKLNIPSETLRRTSSPALDQKLKNSLKQRGVLIPLIVRELGKGEYDIWDGTRRVNALREMNYSGATKIPAIIVDGNDDDSVITQININQSREYLSNLAEAEGLRQLTQDHGWKLTEAAKFLLKTTAWASQVLRVFKLPEPILNALRNHQLALSHAIVISKYLEKPEIMKFLCEKVIKDNVSQSTLKTLGIKAEKNGISAAKKHVPKQSKFGKKSWLRIEPLQKGKRLEIHLEDGDNVKEALEMIEKSI